MRWIALTGPGADPIVPADGDGPAQAPIQRGTYLINFTYEPVEARLNLIRYTTRDPWPAGLTLALDPDGALTLYLTQNDVTRDWTLALPAPLPGDTVIVTFSWDGPGRKGALALWLPDHERLAVLPLTGGVPPLTFGDAARLMGRQCRLAAAVTVTALANGILPAGPLCGIGGSAPVLTPTGPRPIKALEPGDPVLTAGGAVARVLWSGQISLPGRGLTEPLLLRAPYLGLSQDILLSGDQHLRLSGTDIEYLFHAEEVSLSARHLADQRAVIRVPDQAGLTWRQVVIDRPGALSVAGLPVEPLDPLAILAAPTALGSSVLAGMDPALFSAHLGREVPTLRDYEATTLRRLRAA
jgi:hypothetical protein